MIPEPSPYVKDGYGCGPYCVRILLTVAMIPFTHIPYGLLVAPWIIGDDIFVAGMYPACIIFCIIIYFAFLRPFYQKTFMNLDEFKAKVEELRKTGPSPVNRPDLGGPLSIDPVQP